MKLIESQFLPAFFSLPDPVFVIDHEGTILDANEAYGSLLSRNPQECIGNTVFWLLLPDLALKRLEIIIEALRNAKPCYWDDELNGRTIRNRAYPCITPEGEVTRLLIIVHDISDIGEGLKKERELTKTVIESIPGAFYVVDATGKFVYWNHFIRDEIVGKPEHEMKDTVGIDYIHPDDRPLVAENIIKIMQDNQELTTPSRVLFHNGAEFRWLLMTGKRIILDGNPLLMGAGVDITQRKQGEEEIIQLNHELLKAYDTTIEGWSKALDLRDNETEGHTLRVTTMALELARLAGITEEEMGHIKRGALLHDIGKMGIPDQILRKPGKLTEEEWVIMQKHPVFAFQLLSPIEYLHPAMDIPYCHHEKWDGSGYPRGLKGEEIPLSARLFAIVDVWDALSFDRPYRERWSIKKVIEHVKSLSGTDFDPMAVELFLNLIDNKQSISFTTGEK